LDDAYWVVVLANDEASPGEGTVQVGEVVVSYRGTRRNLLGIQFPGHVVVSNDGYYAMREQHRDSFENPSPRRGLHRGAPLLCVLLLLYRTW